MERIRREGYKPEIVDEWLKKRNEEVEAKNQRSNERLSQIRYDLAWRAIGLVIFIIFMLFQFSMCLRFAQH
jgi:ABC-type multidrug transport system permease subunit